MLRVDLKCYNSHINWSPALKCSIAMYCTVAMKITWTPAKSILKLTALKLMSRNVLSFYELLSARKTVSKLHSRMVN